MKIWFDRVLESRQNAHQGDCDDCAECADFTFLLHGETEQVYTGAFKQAASLYRQSCEGGRWLMCNPIGSGHIAVFDAAAMAFFEIFQQPVSIRQASRLFPERLKSDIEQVVRLWSQWGFLQPCDPLIYAQKSETPETLTAWIHVTNDCNLRCDYCYLDKTREDLPEDVGRRAIDAVFRSAQKHHIHSVKLKYAGGEASLHMKALTALHDYAVLLAQEHNIKLEAVILTNGVVLSQRTINSLKERHIAVSISLDGLGLYNDSQRPFSNGHGSAYYVLRTINRLLANDVKPHISITASQRNLDGLPALLSYILEHELPFSLNYYRENECSAHIDDLRYADTQIIGAMRAVFNMIESNLPRRSLLSCVLDKARLHVPHTHTCGVGKNYLVIDQRGGVAKCQVDIRHTVATIDQADPLQAVRDDRAGVQGLTVDQKEGCHTCTWRYWCTGGCPLLTYKVTGRYDVQSPNCSIYKALFPDVLRLEAQRLLRYEAPLVVNEEEPASDQEALCEAAMAVSMVL